MNNHDVTNKLQAVLRNAYFEPVNWHEASEQQWSLALASLVQTAALEDVQFYAYLINQQFPDDRHAQFIRALCYQALQHIPALPFTERETRDYLPFVLPGSDTAILVFCGSAHMVGFPLTFAHRLFGSFNATVIYLFDETKSFYFNGLASISGGFSNTVHFLKAQLAEQGIKHVFCYGTSLGSYAALRFGVALNAKAVLCCAGPTNLTADFLLEHDLHVKRLALVLAEPDNALDLRMSLLKCSQPPKVTLLYGEDNYADKCQANNLKGLSNVQLIGWPGVSDHNIIREVVLASDWYTVLCNWLDYKRI